MQCRSHSAQLGRLDPEFKAANAEVLVILGAAPERVRQYARILKLPFPVLADVHRAVYHQFDLERVFIVIQRTAEVIVDRDGVIRYLKRVTNPLVWLQETRELLEAAQRIAADQSSEVSRQ